MRYKFNPKQKHFIIDKNLKIKGGRNSLFIYGLYNLQNATHKKFKKYVEKKLNIKNKCNDKYELFKYLTLCRILKNLEIYKNYLNCSITHIEKNTFNLNLDYCSMNDIIPDRFIDESNKYENFTNFYKIKDFETYAFDTERKKICDYYVLAFDKKENKWNIFASYDDNEDFDIDEKIKYIKECENENINLFEMIFKLE